MDPGRLIVPIFGQGPSIDPSLDDLFLDDLFSMDTYWSNNSGTNNNNLSLISTSSTPHGVQEANLKPTSLTSLPNNFSTNLSFSSTVSSSPFETNNKGSNAHISAHSIPSNASEKNFKSVSNSTSLPSTILMASPSNPDYNKTQNRTTRNQTKANTESILSNMGSANSVDGYEMNAWLVPPTTVTTSSSSSNIPVSTTKTRGKRGSIVNTLNNNEDIIAKPTSTRKGGKATATTGESTKTSATKGGRTTAAQALSDDEEDMDDNDEDDDEDNSDEDDYNSGNEPSANPGGKRKRSSKDPNDRIARSRERNRIHARKSRMRKKFFVDSLKANIDNLEEENRKLRSLLEQETGKTYEELLQNDKPSHGTKRSHSNTHNNTGTTVSDNNVAIDNDKSHIGDPTRLLAGPGIKPSIVLDGFDYALVKALTTAQQNFVVTDPNLPDNPIVFASQGFYDLTGYNPGEVIGRNCRFLQGPATDPDAIRAIRESINRGVDTAVCLINYKKNGTPFWNQFFIAPLCGTDGRIVNFVGVQCEVKETVARLLIAAQKKENNNTEVNSPTASSESSTTLTSEKK